MCFNVEALLVKGYDVSAGCSQGAEITGATAPSSAFLSAFLAAAFSRRLAGKLYGHFAVCDHMDVNILNTQHC